MFEISLEKKYQVYESIVKLSRPFCLTRLVSNWFSIPFVLSSLTLYFWCLQVTVEQNLTNVGEHSMADFYDPNDPATK